jgi:hypothetical protein
VDEKERTQLRSKVANRAVCAHLGIGADDNDAKFARDRLTDALAAYRTVLLKDQQVQISARNESLS